MKIKGKNEQRGITLIALVVTIVVLLILAGISLNLVLGQNGIVSKSKEAREKGKKDQENTETALNTLYDEMLEAIGEEIEINWTEILADANANPEKYKYPEQQTADIGIGTDGKKVNLDLWYYEVINNNCIQLSTNNYGGSYTSPGYANSNIKEGRIQGKVPQYIKLADQDEFYPVTSMYSTFFGCKDLVIAPEIPDTVTDLSGMFYNCSKLTTLPTIPNGVTNMRHTFFACNSLITAPTIPNGVTNMDITFSVCDSLKTAPTIPNSVTSMNQTFYYCSSLTMGPTIPEDVDNMSGTFLGCSALTGNIQINANPTYYSSCFEKTATKEGTNLIVSGTSTKLNEIIATKSANSNITKGTDL